jgi:hypothetical protein
MNVRRVGDEPHVHPGGVTAQSPHRGAHFTLRTTGQTIVSRLRVLPSLPFNAEFADVRPVKPNGRLSRGLRIETESERHARERKHQVEWMANHAVDANDIATTAQFFAGANIKESADDGA